MSNRTVFHCNVSIENDLNRIYVFISSSSLNLIKCFSFFFLYYYFGRTLERCITILISSEIPNTPLYRIRLRV